MRPLRVRKIARAEILAAFEWYLERSPAAAERFLAAVDDAMRRIEEAPERYPVISWASAFGDRRVVDRRAAPMLACITWGSTDGHEGSR